MFARVASVQDGDGISQREAAGAPHGELQGSAQRWGGVWPGGAGARGGEGGGEAHGLVLGEWRLNAVVVLGLGREFCLGVSHAVPHHSPARHRRHRLDG